MPTSTSVGRRFDVPMIVAWILSNGVRSRRSSESTATSYSRQFSSPPASCTYSRWRPSLAQLKVRIPRSVSAVITRAAAQSTPEPSTPESGSARARIGAIHTFSTPSLGAIHASDPPSGEIRGWIRSGLPKSTLRGMRATMKHAYHTRRPDSAVTPGNPGHGRALPRTTGAVRPADSNSHVTGVFPGSSTARYTLVTVSGPRTSLTGWLARMGFADVPRAERDLAALGIAGGDHPLLAELAQAADPDLALTGLAQVAERDKGLIDGLTKDPAFRSRLIAVLGVSKALAAHLARHPADSAVLRGRDADRRPDPTQLRAELLRAVGADPDDPVPIAAAADAAADAADPAARLAAAYRRGLLHLAARDLTGVITIDETAAELADLADAVLEPALAVARAELA